MVTVGTRPHRQTVYLLRVNSSSVDETEKPPYRFLKTFLPPLPTLFFRCEMVKSRYTPGRFDFSKCYVVSDVVSTSAYVGHFGEAFGSQTRQTDVT